VQGGTIAQFIYVIKDTIRYTNKRGVLSVIQDNKNPAGAGFLPVADRDFLSHHNGSFIASAGVLLEGVVILIVWLLSCDMVLVRPIYTVSGFQRFQKVFH
jgi:hypothetical protein